MPTASPSASPTLQPKVTSAKPGQQHVASSASKLDVPWFSPAFIFGSAAAAIGYVWNQVKQTTSAENVSGGEVAIYKQDAAEATNESTCKLTLIEGVPALTCSEVSHSAYVFPRPSQIVTTNNVPQYEGISGDTYDTSTCRPVEFYGRPSVYCEGENTSMVYTPKLAARPFENASAQIQLAAVGIHLASKAAAWATGKSESEQPEIENEEEAINVADIKDQLNQFKVRLNDIEKYFKRLSKEIAKQPDYAAIGWDLEDYSDKLAKLLGKKSIKVIDVQKLNKKIQALEEYSECVIPRAFDKMLANPKVQEAPHSRFFASSNTPQRVDYAALAGATVNTTQAHHLPQPLVPRMLGRA